MIFPCVDVPCCAFPCCLTHTDCGQLSAVTENALVNTFVCIPLCTSILFGCISEGVSLDQGIGIFLMLLDIFICCKIIAVYAPANTV